LAGLLVALALLIACAHASYLLATRILPEAPASARAAATALIAYVLLVTVFSLLSPLRWFRVGPALAAWIGIAAVVHLWLGRRGAWRRALERDLSAARRAWTAAGWARWVLLATVAVALRVARGLVSPPLGWDSLTYHLAKAGMWVQAGGFGPLPGPDSNGYYDYFPAYGDVLWAWALLPVRGDALLALAGAAVWLTASMATYACARCLGAPSRGALLAALAVCLAPAAATYVATSYVDNLVLATFLVAALFLVRTVTQGSAGDAALAGLALGALAGTKSTGLLVTGAAFAVLAAAAVRPARRSKWFLLVPLAAAFGAFPYLRSWVETGNPLYPFPVSIGGHPIFPAAPGVLENWAERARDSPPFSLFLFVARLATPIPLVPEADRMGFGPGVLLLVPLGVLGAVRLVRQRRTLAVGVLVAVAAALVISQFGAPWIWIVDIGSVQRYMLGVYACFAVMAASLERRKEQVALAAVAILGAGLALPRGIGPAERGALLSALPALGLVGSSFAVGALLLVRGRTSAASAVALAGVLAALALLAPVRARVRHDVYRDAALNRSFDPHFLHSSVSRAWPIWKAFDGESQRRIAVSAGYDPFPNWYWYPLLGTKLQNRVAYVPITADGGRIDYRDADETSRRASFTAWLRRLLDAGIEEVVLLAPAPPEAEWVASAPDVFAPGAASTDGTSGAFRFRADAARELVRSDRVDAPR
jgi:hypothetical protein